MRRGASRFLLLALVFEFCGSPKSVPRKAIRALHRLKANNSGMGTKECKGNTIYCGLPLTCPTDSGIFPSAAENGLQQIPARITFPQAANRREFAGSFRDRIPVC